MPVRQTSPWYMALGGLHSNVGWHDQQKSSLVGIATHAMPADERKVLFVAMTNQPPHFWPNIAVTSRAKLVRLLKQSGAVNNERTSLDTDMNHAEVFFLDGGGSLQMVLRKEDEYVWKVRGLRGYQSLVLLKDANVNNYIGFSIN